MDGQNYKMLPGKNEKNEKFGTKKTLEENRVFRQKRSGCFDRK